MKFDFDVIVVGGGHAGCEAAMAASNMGSRVLLVSMDLNGFAKMSCNPSIGGIAKGQIIREVDALGGYTGIITDRSTLQFRMLNRSKGPAMWSPRAQCDKLQFSLNWRSVLEKHSNLSLYADLVTSFIIEHSKIVGIKTTTGATFHSKCTVLTAGTFLSGKLFVGRNVFAGGRIGELPSYGLTEQLVDNGLVAERMKTGTPPRIDIKTVDLSKAQIQLGDTNPDKFSYLPVFSTVQGKGSTQMPCFIFHTNERVHSVLREGFVDSPLFNGLIHGRGPRYCPSIEDKLRTFADKDSHQLFLEPEGKAIDEYYLQGFSSSLPFDIQVRALQQMDGFENVQLIRPAYAVEYDFFDPTGLKPTLETKAIENLFLAGQVNGTTGYEEAAAQGIIAGINANLKSMDKDPFILNRNEAYIGVLIDDLITKGVDEPYRMFTSRAEYRILLRQDNADYRLTEKSYNIGLASKERYDFTLSKYDFVSKLDEFVHSYSLKPDIINPYLNSIDSAEISESKRISDLLGRTGSQLKDIVKYVPRGTINKYGLEYNSFNDSDIDSFVYTECLDSEDINIKYQGYIVREQKIADKLSKFENMIIPDTFDFDSVSGLSIECRQKLKRYSPKTIGQASRISGVSPSDISVLLVYIGR